jgi:hypothetical protein
VENLFKFDCPQVAEAIGYFVNGLKNRTVASHKFNRSSSRSHSIFTVYVDLLSGASELIQQGKISFVDLAGSERVSMTGNTGALLQQSISINKSLFVLRKVIDALAATQRKKSRGGGGGRKRKQKGKNTSTKPHIPFRDSVLTRLLKDSLGGNCRTLMLACLCPQDDMVEENLSTLNYAARTKTIKNKAKVNQDAKTALILRLRAEIKQLKAMLGRNTQLQSMTQGMEHDLATAVAATPAAPLEHKVEVQTQAKSPMSYSRVHDRVLSEKFVRSIELMKSVIADNNSLQESYQEIATQVEEYEYDNETLNTENNELRNRISFLENILVEAQAMPVTRANAAAATTTPESKDEDGDEEEDTEDSVAQKLFKSEQENSALRQALYTNEQELKRCLALLAESTRRPRTSRRKAGR